MESLGQQNLADIPQGKTAESPQFKRARLEEPLEDEQENQVRRNRKDRSGEHTHDEESRETQFFNSRFYSGQTSV